MSDEDWGPWIEHDGKGCHVRGQYVYLEAEGPQPFWECIAGCDGGGSWDRRNKHLFQVLRYRIRKPKGLKMLEELIQNLPTPTKEKEKV